MGSIAKALNHFDKFYPYYYSAERWRSIRLGLLCASKKMFLINNAYSDKGKLIGQLKMNGAKDFLNDLFVKEKEFSDSDHEYLQDNQTFLGTQLNEFVKSTKYVGEKDFFTRKISNSFTNYSSNFEDKELTAYLKEDLRDVKLKMISFEAFDLPTSLKVLAYPCGVVKKKFEVPHDECHQAGFYPIDGFSILVVLLMNIQKGDKILDMCAAPGGKSITMLQTGLPSELVCMDKAKTRLSRLENILKTHSFPEDRKKVTIIHGDSIDESRFMNDYFDKVLVDAPCSTDRHAVTDRSFSLFSPRDDKLRDNLSSTQLSLLRMAVRSCKMGGDIVYSTCTLSPVQNDQVVVSAVKEINSQEDRFKLSVVNCRAEYFRLSERSGGGESPSQWYSTFGSPDTLGQIILPNLLNNYGPGYVCKIRKVAT